MALTDIFSVNQPSNDGLWNNLYNPPPVRIAMEDFKREQQIPSEVGLGVGGPYPTRPYSTAPDSLMGFRKNGPQKGYDETNYKYELPVRVTFPASGALPSDTFEDGIRGLNKSHALERAHRNWPGAIIEPLK